MLLWTPSSRRWRLWDLPCSRQITEQHFAFVKQFSCQQMKQLNHDNVINNSIIHCVLLLPSYEPYSRWPPWANVRSKSSCGDERGLEELLNKRPMSLFQGKLFFCTQTSLVEGRSPFVTAELAVLVGLLLVLVEIKGIGWQAVKKKACAKVLKHT